VLHFVSEFRLVAIGDRPRPINRLILLPATAEPSPVGKRVFAVRQRLSGNDHDNVPMRIGLRLFRTLEAADDEFAGGRLLTGRDAVGQHGPRPAAADRIDDVVREPVQGYSQLRRDGTGKPAAIIGMRVKTRHARVFHAVRHSALPQNFGSQTPIIRS
jgi:hypothetical protein